MPTYQVSLLGNNHRFLNPGLQSILHAGLASGYNLKYGCEGGNCGECLAWLQSGKLKTIRHSDYQFSTEEKQQKAFLMCCKAPDSDIEIEAIEHGVAEDIPQQAITAKVYSKSLLTESALMLTLRTPRSQSLKFLAGQYVTLKLDNGLSRNKSIASCPCDGLNPVFHVHLNANNAFDKYVFEQLKKNEKIQILGPQGNFILNDDSIRPILLIAFNTGFASINGLLDHLIALEKAQDIELYWMMSPGHEEYLANYCHSIDDAFDNLYYNPICLPDTSTESLDLVISQIIQSHPNLSEFDIFAALPTFYHQRATELFTSANVAVESLKLDYLEKL